MRYRREIRGIAVFRAIPSSLGAVTKEYCDHHTDLTDEIRHVFEAVLMVEHLKLGPYDVSGSFGESVQSIGKRLAQVGDHRILVLVRPRRHVAGLCALLNESGATAK